MRFGAKVPNLGPQVAKQGLLSMARALEEAGFDSLWLSDHVIIPSESTSVYPFSPTGKSPSPPNTPWYDSVVCLAQIAAVTQRAEIGIGVAVISLRNPVILAKQLASIDALCGGRVTLGAGAGWLAEEFTALQVPFKTRGTRLDEWMDILRACWTGNPGAFEGEHYALPPGLMCFPTPAHSIPIVVGGMGMAAVKRAGTTGDGWFAFMSSAAPDVDVIERSMVVLGQKRAIVRVSGKLSPAFLDRISELQSLGVTDVVVDVDWSNASGPQDTYRLLTSAGRSV